MKKAIIRSFIVALLFIGDFKPAKAQTECDLYLEVKASLIKKGWTVAEDTYCDIGQGSTCYLYRNFYKENEYFICAFSCDADVTDIDLYLYESDNRLYKKDIGKESYGKLDFNPYTSREMKIIAKSHASETPSYKSRVRILVFFR